MLSPRNEEKKSYTRLPPAFLETVQEVFDGAFEDQSKEGEFIVLGQAYQGEVVLRVGYLKKNSIAQINFDTSIDVPESASEILPLIEEMVYGTKELFVDYFKNNNLENFSYHWNPLQTSSKGLFYKYDTTNTKLEEEANSLLGEKTLDNSLVKGNMEESLEIEKIIESLEKENFNFK